jgi:exosortase
LAVDLGWSYAPTLTGLAERWSQDPRYSHGYVVPLLVLLVLWSRRHRCPHPPWKANWLGAAFLVLAAGIRLGGACFSYEWFDGFSLAPTLVGIGLLAGGRPLLRWGWPAICFLCFMLPLPYEAETALARPLQHLATVCGTYALQTLGFPAVAEGNVILVEDLRIGVLEACSGLGMLATFFALSTAVAFLVRRPLLDRLILLASAAPIGVAANVVRITATGALHQVAGSAMARAVYHDLAGWLMMPLALTVLWLELWFLGRLFVLPSPSGAIPLPPSWCTPVPPAARTMPIPAPTAGR